MNLNYNDIIIKIKLIYSWKLIYLYNGKYVATLFKIINLLYKQNISAIKNNFMTFYGAVFKHSSS